MAALYADENFPLPVVEELRNLGHDVLTLQETGQGGQAIPDETVLIFARTEGRAVLTLNRRHFITLHNTRRSGHAGIIVCSYDPDFVGQAHRIHRALDAQDDLSGQLVRINRPSV